jgi:hypothetical protein
VYLLYVTGPRVPVRFCSLAIMVTLRQHRPGDPGGLMVLCDAGTVLPAPGFDPLEPATPVIRLAIDAPQHRAGAMDEEGAEGAIHALRHPKQGRLPPGRMLTGDEAQPRGTLATMLERGRIGPLTATALVAVRGPMPASCASR